MTKKFPAVHRTPEVYCYIQNSPPLGHILSQLNPFQWVTPYFLNISFYNKVPSTYVLLSGLFPSDFWIKFYIHFSSPIRATSPIHLIILVSIITMMTDKEYRLCYSIISPLLISSLLRFRTEEDESWRKLYNDELHSLYSSPNIVRVIK